MILGPSMSSCQYFIWILTYFIQIVFLEYNLEKAAKFCEISTLLLFTVHTDKSKVEIAQNFVAFSEYMNFNVLRILFDCLWKS